MSLQSLGTLIRSQASATRVTSAAMRRLTMSAVARDFDNARKQDAIVTPAQEERQITPVEAVSGAPGNVKKRGSLISVICIYNNDDMNVRGIDYGAIRTNLSTGKERYAIWQARNSSLAHRF